MVKEASLGCGGDSLPFGIKEMMLEATQPEVPWTHVLHNFITQATRYADYTYARPNRRTQHLGVITPSLKVPRLVGVIAIDCSGSCMSEEIQRRFLDEASGILASIPYMEVDMIWVDTRVRKTEHYTRGDLPLKPEYVYGGGTAFYPAFDWVQDQGIIPDFFIYLTDMQAGNPFFDNPPTYPILWAAVGGYYPDWAEEQNATVVRIDGK